MPLVLHVPYTYHPDPCGGTEIYVGNLVRELAPLGWTGAVAAPAPSASQTNRDGIPVLRFPTNVPVDPAALYENGDPAAADAFGRILDELRPALVHLHASSRAVSVLLVRAAKARGVPVLFTYHTPTVTCLRGTLMLEGRTVCDGVMEPARCAACAAMSKGVPRLVAHALAHLPRSLGQITARIPGARRTATALRIREYTEASITNSRRFLAEVDQIVAVRSWVRDVLLRNGIPASKITLSPHGVPSATPSPEPISNRPPNFNLQSPNSWASRRDPPPTPNSNLQSPAVRGTHGQNLVRLVFLGRLDWTKGLDLTIRAIRSLPDAAISLAIHAVNQDNSRTGYAAEIARLAADDPRISFPAPVPASEVPALLAHYDALVVPSRWMETGPLVILEAFAAGIPVIASRLGGPAEIVTDNVDGILVDPDSQPAWNAVLRRILHDTGLLPRLRKGVQPPRTTADVARDMDALYHRLLPSP